MIWKNETAPSKRILSNCESTQELVFPSLFMNNEGEPVATWYALYHLTARLVDIHKGVNPFLI